MTLLDILNQVSERAPHAWLCLPGDVKLWTPDTEAYLVNPEFESGKDDPIWPDFIVQKGFRETLDTQTILDCVRWADRLAGHPDADARFQSFIYYVRFDAFLPKIGAPDPPPWDETQRALDLKFYEQLGPEDLARPCRHDGCSRGAVRFSVLCKRHHFEMINHRQCPFDH
jgi:hypothetical protein